MTRSRPKLAAAVALSLICGVCALSVDLNTEMMKATVRIDCASVSGTGFVLVLPTTDNVGVPVLVTARHVFDSAGADFVTLNFHESLPDSTYRSTPLLVRVREVKGKDTTRLYLFHADRSIDVAVLPLGIRIPQQISWRAPAYDWLVPEDSFASWGLRPGDEVFTVGYPRGAMSPGGFAILRSARISSYPLAPIRRLKRFYLDMQVYFGCSGSPVYIQQTGRRIGHGVHLDREYSGILGLVSNQVLMGADSTPIMVSIVQPSCFIRDLLDSAKARLGLEYRPQKRTGQR